MQPDRPPTRVLDVSDGVVLPSLSHKSGASVDGNLATTSGVSEINAAPRMNRHTVASQPLWAPPQYRFSLPAIQRSVKH